MKHHIALIDVSLHLIVEEDFLPVSVELFILAELEGTLEDEFVGDDDR